MAKPMMPTELEWRRGPVPPPSQPFAVVLTWHNGSDTRDLIGNKVRLAPSFRTIIAADEGFEGLEWRFEDDSIWFEDDDPAQCDWWAYVGAYDTRIEGEEQVPTTTQKPTEFKSWVFCGHANENPNRVCTCPPNCACRERMCPIRQ